MKTYISEFGIENFKVFSQKFNFEFAPITILTGTNSSGKSSLTKAYFLLSQCYKDGLFREIIDIEDILNILGDFSNLPNKNNKNKELSFYVPIVLRGIPEKMKLKLNYKLIQNDPLKRGMLSDIIIISEKSDNKEIFRISQKETNDFIIKINFAFFLEEYKRESEQIFNYKNTLAEQNSENIKSKHNILDNDEVLKSKHPYYYDFNKKKVKNNNYIPFFDKYPGFFNDNRYMYINNDIKYSNIEPVFYSANQKLINVEQLSTNNEEKVDIDEISKKFESEFLLKSEITVAPSHEQKYSNKKMYETIFNQIYYKQNYIIKSVLSAFNILVKGSDHYASFNLEEFDLPIEFYKLKIKGNLNIRINNFFFDCFVNDNIIYSINEAFKNVNNSFFFKSLNNSNQRTYSTYDGSNFQQLIKKIILYKEKPENNKILKFIKKSLTRLDIGHDIILIRGSEGQGDSVYILSKNSQPILLADLGYGINQVMPLIFKIVIVALEDGNNKKLFIEEPESNLHPALQSKIAELIVEAASNFGIQFVIETHSEYLIRKLQVLTANSYATKGKDNRLPNLKTEDTVFYYFYHPDKVPNGEKQVYKINIEKDGGLTKNFGKGFFDESSNLNIALYNYSKVSKN